MSDLMQNYTVQQWETHNAKTCPKCKISKPRSEFRNYSQTQDGLSTYCVPCIRQQTRDAYHKRQAIKKGLIQPKLADYTHDEKTCARCKEVKPSSEFPKYKKARAYRGVKKAIGVEKTVSTPIVESAPAQPVATFTPTGTKSCMSCRETKDLSQFYFLKSANKFESCCLACAEVRITGKKASTNDELFGKI